MLEKTGPFGNTYILPIILNSEFCILVLLAQRKKLAEHNHLYMVSACLLLFQDSSQTESNAKKWWYY